MLATLTTLLIADDHPADDHPFTADELAAVEAFDDDALSQRLADLAVRLNNISDERHSEILASV